LKKVNDSDAITGIWNATPTSSEAPRGFGEFAFYLQLKEDGSLTGLTESRGRRQEIQGGKFNSETGEFTWETQSPRGTSKFSGKLVDGALQGALEAGGGRFKIEFKGTLKDPSTGGLFSLPSGVPSLRDDGVSGVWKASSENENLPNGKLEFDLELTVNDKNEVSGKITSVMGELKIVEGKYTPDTKKLLFIGESDDLNVEFNATVDGKKLTGEMTPSGMGDVRLPFSAEWTGKVDAPEAEAPAAEGKQEEMPKQEEAKPAEPKQEEPKQEAKQTEAEKPAQPAASEGKQEEAKPATESTTEAAPAKDDPISGTWKGNMLSEQMPRGMGEFTMELKLGDQNKVTGSMSNQRGDNEITDGKYDPEKKTVELAIDSGRFSMNFNGKLEGEKLSGDVDMGGGQFQLGFEANRTAKASGAAPAAAGAAPAAAASGKLETLVPGPRWVSALEASRFKPGRVYLTLDGHRSNDDEPYAFASEDFGATWKSIRGNLPSTAGSTRVIREDIKNENVLYLGCEFGAWVSVDRGEHWTKFGGLPTVAVHDFAQHPTSGEIVAGTHGRSLWIGDVSALRQVSNDSIAAKAKLYAPQEVIRWQSEAPAGDTGPRRFVGQNPGGNARIAYSLGGNAQNLELTISDALGNVVRRFDDAKTEKGMHVIEWDFRPTPRPQAAGAGQRGGRGGFGGGGGGGPGGRGGFGARSGLGTYLITLRVDGAVETALLKVSGDPDLPADAVPQAWEETFEEFFQQAETEENGQDGSDD
jgi:hypothetical protein